MADKLYVSGARGASFAEVARRVGTIAGVPVPADATDAEVLDLIGAGFAEIVAAAGYNVVDPVRVATTANIAHSGFPIIDGVQTVNGDRILDKDHSNPALNGIWVAASGFWSRATDFDATAEVVKGSFVVVQEGTQAGGWVLVTPDPITVGTTAQTWRLFRADDAAKLREELMDDAGDMVSVRHPQAPSIVTSLGDALPTLNAGAFFDIKSDGSTDDTLKLQSAIDALSAVADGPGITLDLKPGARTVVADQIVIKPNVRLRLNGGELQSNLSGGAVAGVVPLSYSEVCDGKITVVSTGAPGSQAGAHAPVRVGPEYDGGASDPLHGQKGWKVRNLILTTNKLLSEAGYPLGIGAPGVQVYGAARDGLIADIVIPDNDRMAGGVMMDWIPSGGITSLDSAMHANRQLFEDGDGWTEHPSNIDVLRVQIGNLSRASSGLESGSFGIRLSGVSDVRVFQTRLVYASSAALRITAGDLGYEFARGDARDAGMSGIIVRDFRVSDPLIGNASGGGSSGYLAYLDSLADNVQRAIADYDYDALANPLYEAGLEIDGLYGTGDGGANSQDGVRCNHLFGAKLRNIRASGFKRGVLIEEGARAIKIVSSSLVSNRSHGIEVQHGGTPPVSITVAGNTMHSNGTGGGSAAGVFWGTSTDVLIEKNDLGLRNAHDPSQVWNIRVDGGIVTGRLRGNVHHSTKSDGTAESILSDATSDYGKIIEYQPGVFPDASKINVRRSGLNLIALETHVGSDNVARGHYLASATAAPSGTPAGGTFVAGETLQVEATGLRTRCTVSGSPGTWA